MGGGSRSRAKEAEGESEVRPGGMFVQRRDGEEGPTLRLRVSHGPALRDVFVPAQATFGEMKRILTQTTGLEPERQRLFFRGKEKRDDEFLHASGAKDGAKLLLLEKHVPANVEQKVEPVMMDESMMRACEAVVRVRSEVDKLSAKVCELEKSVLAGKKVVDKEFVVLTELLMVQLLKLDGIEAEGEARAQRKAEHLRSAMRKRRQMLDVMVVPRWDGSICTAEEMRGLFGFGTTTSKKILPFLKVIFVEGIECLVIYLTA